MNGTLKAQKHGAGRQTIRRSASYSLRFAGLSVAEFQRPVFARGYFSAVHRQQQWKTGAMRKAIASQGMDQQRDYSQGKKRVACGWNAVRNQERSEAKQSELVCPNLAESRLVAGNGYKPRQFHPGSISKNNS